MTAAEKFIRVEASRARRSTSDVTTERRPMPRTPRGRIADFAPVAKAWRVVKVKELPVHTKPTAADRVVLSAHDSQEVALRHAGEGRDALTDAEVGQGWNVVTERRPRGKR
jgi:hypothetical protein